MILAAALLVLVGLGLFVAGILTGATVLYWACVAACVVAAVLIIAARRQLARETADGTSPGPTPASAGTTTDPGSIETPSAGATATGAPADSGPVAAAPPDEPPGRPVDHLPDPDVEEVEVTDLLVVVDLKDEVLVVDEHPRYHVAGCRWLGGRETIPLPIDEARTDGFTPCAVCAPDRTLADRARARRHAAPEG